MQTHAVATILLVLFTTVCHADEWRSVDGQISLAQPSPERFQAGELTPPMSVVWVSADESLKLGVVEMEHDQRLTINRQAMETAFANEIGGAITESSTDELAGFQTYTMTAVGSVSDVEIHAKQKVVAIASKVYKVMAIGVGTNVEDVEDVDTLFASLKINAVPNSALSRATNPISKSNAGDLLDDTNKVDSISGKVGAAGVLLLAGLGIAHLLRASNRRKK